MQWNNAASLIRSASRWTLACLLFLSFGFCPGARAADGKIATVDFRKVFLSYYKTTQAIAARSNGIAQFEKDRQVMTDQCNTNKEQWRLLLTKAQDPTFPADERAKYKNAAESLEYQILLQGQTMTNLLMEAGAKIDDDWSRHGHDIVAEIRLVLEAMAKKQGYTLVLDRSALNDLGTPIFLNMTEENDLTEALLKQLNSTAPPFPASKPNGSNP